MMIFPSQSILSASEGSCPEYGNFPTDVIRSPSIRMYPSRITSRRPLTVMMVAWSKILQPVVAVDVDMVGPESDVKSQISESKT
jgi:hypothetical protein